jgi:hypothetical protein
MTAVESQYDFETKTGFLQYEISTTPILPNILVSEVFVQFGSINNSCPYSVRLWTQDDDILLLNDLIDCGMSTKYSNRMTLNTTDSSTSIFSALAQEVSPHVKLTKATCDGLSDMHAKLLIHVSDPLGVTSEGSAYIGRTDVVVVRQDAGSYMTRDHVFDIKSRCAPLTNVIFIMVAANHTKMYDDTLDNMRDCDNVIVLPSVAKRISLCQFVDSICSLKEWESIFKSCSISRDNFKFTVNGSDDAQCYYLQNGKHLVPAENMTRLFKQAPLFVPHKLVVISTSTSSLQISYSYSDNLIQFSEYILRSSDYDLCGRGKYAAIIKTWPEYAPLLSSFIHDQLMMLLPTDMSILAPWRALRAQIEMGCESDAVHRAYNVLDEEMRATKPSYKVEDVTDLKNFLYPSTPVKYDKLFHLLEAYSSPSRYCTTIACVYASAILSNGSTLGLAAVPPKVERLLSQPIQYGVK